MTDWNAGDDPDVHILTITLLDVEGGGLGADENGEIGFFTDDNGEDYFMITNLYRAKNTASADAELQFQIQFDGTIAELLRRI